MDLLLILTYAAICVGVFKVFKIPLNKWTVPTAVLGGVVLIGALLLLMNYNHPYTDRALMLFSTVPIVPEVAGTVVEVPVKPNTPLAKGDVLFQIDPTPYKARLDRLNADLVSTLESATGFEAELAAAIGEVGRATAERDKAKRDYARYADASKMKTSPFTEQEVTNARQALLAAEAQLRTAEAKRDAAQTKVDAQVGGENSVVVSLRAQIKEAQFNLDATTVRAPSEGFVTQMFLRPGVRAVNLPLRPSMVFVPKEQILVTAGFRQNSLLRVKVGDAAEVAFTGIPGSVFKGKVVKVIPVIANGEAQASGNLQGLRFNKDLDDIYAQIALEDDMSSYGLPAGVYAQVAIYTEHFHHVSILRKVLLRMTSWMHYLYLDH